MGQCFNAAPKVREIPVQQARHYEPGDSDDDLDETLVEELTDLRFQVQKMRFVIANLSAFLCVLIPHVHHAKSVNVLLMKSEWQRSDRARCAAPGAVFDRISSCACEHNFAGLAP